jgi:hypothetical protein
MPPNLGPIRRFAVPVAAVIAVILPATAAASATAQAAAAGRVTYRPACAQPAAQQMACLAIVDSNAAGRPLTRSEAAADGLQPYLAADLRAAYKLPSTLLGERQTIAIVDAGDDPNAAADLAVYRSANGLPPCTTANGCFRKFNQKGRQGNYPSVAPGWQLEESLDVDMASAICPNCHIDLVEANSAADSDLYAAEDEAARLGPDVISNSWGQSEYNGEQAACRNFDHHGIAVTVSAGDSGFGVSFPAACAAVTAVGGTTLYRNSSARGWGEAAWGGPAEDGGTGSGCSAYIPKPSWQHDPLCAMRTTADVSAVADPATPVAVYDTYGAYSGWVAVGGTSVASPLIASVYALAGNTATIGSGASWLYAHHRHLYDVTSGSDGTCGGSYLCTARKGYDGPTGWGTPDGIGAF